jgi:microcystin-dependent protein
MADPFVGEIRLVAFNRVPPGWARCDGQLLSISQNTTLFSLLGSTYGGDGKSTFALPDLRGRAPLHSGPDDPMGERSPIPPTVAPHPGRGRPSGPPTLALSYIIALQGQFPPAG